MQLLGNRLAGNDWLQDHVQQGSISCLFSPTPNWGCSMAHSDVGCGKHLSPVQATDVIWFTARRVGCYTLIGSVSGENGFCKHRGKQHVL